LTVEKLTQAAGSLGEFPELGEVLPEFAHRVYRQLTVSTYRLIYRFDVPSGRVLIMAVVHAARDLPPVLEQR
jgi:plasmid stabilization system protein ParE